MKNILLILFLMFSYGLNGQALEVKKATKDIKLLSVPLNPTPKPMAPVLMDVIDRAALEKKIRQDITQQMAAACDERQLAIEKMKLEIECRGITPGELGIPPDTVNICESLGLYSEWTVRAISRTRIGGTYTALLDPSTPLTTPGPTGTRRERAIVGFDEFIPVGTVIIMAEK